MPPPQQERTAIGARPRNAVKTAQSPPSLGATITPKTRGNGQCPRGGGFSLLADHRGSPRCFPFCPLLMRTYIRTSFPVCRKPTRRPSGVGSSEHSSFVMKA
ncbi:unnamed protein product [Ectocarpus sp. 8 AP-2014]